MATSPNFSWPEPDNTDLVKNGALAIRTAVDAIDSSMVDLKGGTTGQVLTKASNTDMDFSWVADATGIPATIFDAKGDIIAATAADTASRLAVGTNGQILVADSSTATGLKWATAGGSSPASATAYIGTSQSTTSTTFTDLATAGPAVTLTTGTKAIALITARFTSPAAANARMGLTVSGSSTIAASDDKATSQTVSNDDRWSLAIPYTTLTAGSNTFTCKYRTGGGSGTSTYEQREITVIDLGS